MNNQVNKGNIGKKKQYQRKEILNSLFNVYNKDAVALLRTIPRNTIDLLLTDIPYEKVNKHSNWIRILDKGNANIITFKLWEFLIEVDRVTKWSWYIFCGKE